MPGFQLVVRVGSSSPAGAPPAPLPCAPPLPRCPPVPVALPPLPPPEPLSPAGAAPHAGKSRAPSTMESTVGERGSREFVIASVPGYGVVGEAARNRARLIL